MRSRRIVLAKAAVTLFTSAVLGLGLEGLLRVYFSFHQAYIVEMWRYGRNHKRFVDDVRSHEHIPGSTSRVMGKPVRIDRWGYRGPDREPDPKARRILVLGDSITFGFGVAEEEAYPALLEARLPGTQVWNAGVGNYNTAQEMATLRDHVERLHPTEVVLGFFINDLEPVQRTPGLPFLQGSLLVSLSTQVWWSYGDQMRGNFQQYYQHWFDVGWATWAAAAEEGIRYLAASRIPLKVLLIPELHVLGKDTFTKNYRRVEEFFSSRGIPVCDAAPFFPPSPSGGREYWAARDDSHPNALGHRVLVDALCTSFYPKQ